MELVDVAMQIPDAKTFAMCRRIYGAEGWLPGPSGGLAAAAAEVLIDYFLALDPDGERDVVIVFPDSGEKSRDRIFGPAPACQADADDQPRVKFPMNTFWRSILPK